jgi:hypothetical protein
MTMPGGHISLAQVSGVVLTITFPCPFAEVEYGKGVGVSLTAACELSVPRTFCIFAEGPLDVMPDIFSVFAKFSSVPLKPGKLSTKTIGCISPPNLKQHMYQV